MPRFVIYSNPYKPQAVDIARFIQNYIHEKGYEAIEAPRSKLLNSEENEAKCTSDRGKDLDAARAVQVPGLTETSARPATAHSLSIETSDIAIVIGGDGTILRALHTRKLSSPVLGINLGSLGFMADVQLEGLTDSMEELLSGRYSIQERLMLEVQLGRKTYLALNDIVIHRASCPGLVELDVEVEGSYLNTFCGDGLICATPNGSTAYSLAAGGPILTPEMNSIVITPISPHTISNRPIVLDASRQLTLSCMEASSPIEVTVDGFKCSELTPGGCATVVASNQKFQRIHLDSHDYFSTLRSKLGWSGNIRSRRRKAEPS